MQGFAVKSEVAADGDWRATRADMQTQSDNGQILRGHTVGVRSEDFGTVVYVQVSSPGES
jgi:hypothetical protein